MPRILRDGKERNLNYVPKRKRSKRSKKSKKVEETPESSMIIESTQSESQCATSSPGIISSQVIVPAELSGAAVIPSSQEKQHEFTKPAPNDDWRRYREKKRKEKEERENREPDRSRCFLLTFNSRLEEACKKIEAEECKYLKIGGIEQAPTTGHNHQHCVIYFKNARYTNSMKSKYNSYGEVRAVEMKDKDIQKVLNYAVKEGNIVFEKGEKPEQGFRSDLERQIKTHDSITDLLLDRPDIYARNRNGIQDYYNQKDEDTLLNKIFGECISGEIHQKKINIVYITGKSGTGKSTSAAKYAHDKFGYEPKDMGYLKFDGSFCTGRRVKAKCLLWREFRSEQLPASGFYQLCDKLGYSINIKHSSEFIRPETIIFDSIIPLDQIYGDETGHHRYQIFRRITNYVECTYDYTFKELNDELHALQEKYKNFVDEQDGRVQSSQKQTEEKQ